MEFAASSPSMVSHQRDPGIVHSGEAAPLRRLLAILRKIEVTRAKPPEPRNGQQRFIDEYRRYLLRERGLAETSLLNYVPFAEQFLSGRFGQADIKLPELTAADVTKFMRDRGPSVELWPCQVAGDRSSIFLTLFATPGGDFR
jgi:hypothetical protein